jgi:hypothetical protein
VWTRTEDNVSFELCCIPFFKYGLSLGDVVRTTADDGKYEIVPKSGHRTIRFAVQDEKFRHEGHDSLLASIASAGCLNEFHGHMRDRHRQRASIGEHSGAAEPTRRARTLLVWEWADPVVRN